MGCSKPGPRSPSRSTWRRIKPRSSRQLHSSRPAPSRFASPHAVFSRTSSAGGRGGGLGVWGVMAEKKGREVRGSYNLCTPRWWPGCRASATARALSLSLSLSLSLYLSLTLSLSQTHTHPDGGRGAVRQPPRHTHAHFPRTLRCWLLGLGPNCGKQFENTLPCWRLACLS